MFICGYLLSPVREQNEEIRNTNDTVVIQVWRAVFTMVTWTPTGKKNEEIGYTDLTIAIQITGYALLNGAKQ